MNRLSLEKQEQILALLVEGNSIRSIVRLTGFSKNTIGKLVYEIGRACFNYEAEHVHNLPCKRIQVDELWSFVYCKEHKRTPGMHPYAGGDIYTWVAICADSKFIPLRLVGKRDSFHANFFMHCLKAKLGSQRIQLTTDGLRAYPQAVRSAFKDNIDYATLIKLHPEDGTMRMSMRRFTRDVYAHSKSFEQHCAAVDLHFTWYNFARTHSSIKTSPAVALGLTNKVWTLRDIVNLRYEYDYEPLTVLVPYNHNKGVG